MIISEPTDTSAACDHRAAGIADIAVGRNHASCDAAALYDEKAHRSSSFSPRSLTPPKM